MLLIANRITGIVLSLCAVELVIWLSAAATGTLILIDASLKFNLVYIARINSQFCMCRPHLSKIGGLFFRGKHDATQHRSDGLGAVAHRRGR